MQTIGETNVHYIRCIKPNEAKIAWEFDGPMVLSQLRACGVLETIRISCLGYPSRWSFEEFAERYYALVPSKEWDTSNIKGFCVLILNACIPDEDKYQVGESKIFFRAGQLAFMERLRSDRYDACATMLQKNMRRFVYRRRYLRIKELIIQLQCLARQRAAQQKLQDLRRNRAAIVIQKNFKRYIVQKEFKAKKEFVLRLQKGIKRNYSCNLLLNIYLKRSVAIKHVKNTKSCEKTMLLYKSNVMLGECKLQKEKKRKEKDLTFC
jgi:myosin-5